VAISNDGRRVASATDENDIDLSQIDPTLNGFGKTLLTLKGHTGVITSINFSQDDSLLVTGSLDNSVIIWGVDSNFKDKYGKMLVKLLGHNGFIRDACFSPDMNFVVTASIIKHLSSFAYGAIIWSFNNKLGKYKAIKKLVHPSEILSLRFSLDGKMLAAFCKPNYGYIWNTDIQSDNFGNKIVKLANVKTDWIKKYIIR